MSDSGVPFGDWLLDQLDRRGWTQAEFAARADLYRPTVHRWVRKGQIPDADYWPKIAHALGVSIDVVANAAHGFPLSQTRTDAIVDHQLKRVLEEQSQLLRYLEEVNAVPKGVPVPILGFIPADTFRWVSQDRQGTVDVLESDLRGAHSPYALIATGDCMMQIGIVTGVIVILDRPDGRQPTHGQVVAVRVNQDEYTLKRWMVIDGEPQLHDGAGNVVYRINPLDDVDIIGFYVTHKPGEPR